MKEIAKNLEESDFEVEIINHRMEIRLANDFRKKVKANRRDPQRLLPKSFKISGIPGVEEPVTIEGNMFTLHNSWSIFFLVDPEPKQLKSDLPKEYSISHVVTPPKEGYIYWNRETGEIYAIAPHPLDDPKTGDYPFVVPLEVTTSFLSGEKSRHDYYIGPSAEGKLELKKRAADFSLITDVARISQLSEILEENTNPDIEVIWDKKEKILSIHLLTKVLPYHKHWLNFYITKRDDPYYLIRILKIQVVELIQAENGEIFRKIDTNKDVSIYTNLVFDNYNLVRRYA